jgi:hypothetical protein
MSIIRKITSTGCSNGYKESGDHRLHTTHSGGILNSPSSHLLDWMCGKNLVNVGFVLGSTVVLVNTIFNILLISMTFCVNIYSTHSLIPTNVQLYICRNKTIYNKNVQWSLYIVHITVNVWNNVDVGSHRWMLTSQAEITFHTQAEAQASVGKGREWWTHIIQENY